MRFRHHLIHSDVAPTCSVTDSSNECSGVAFETVPPHVCGAVVTNGGIRAWLLFIYNSDYLYCWFSGLSDWLLSETVIRCSVLYGFLVDCRVGILSLLTVTCWYILWLPLSGFLVFWTLLHFALHLCIQSLTRILLVSVTKGMVSS